MARIDVTLDDKKVLADIQLAVNLGKDFSKPLKQAGILIMRETDKRFKQMVSPSGARWKPLSDKTLQRRRKGKKKGRYGDAILRDTGRLWRSIVANSGSGHIYRQDKKSVEVGTNVNYANAHQFGVWGRIPPRPFLGVNSKDMQNILKIFGDFVDKTLGAK